MNFKDIFIAGLTGNNINDYFKIMFNRWLFDYSDEVILNGKILSKSKKKLIKISFYNIKPKPITITANGIINGSKLTEKRFIEYEIKRIENLNDLSLGKKYIKQDYLNFLYTKKENLPPQPISTEQNGTKKIIGEYFEAMDSMGYKYAFKSEQDYNVFTDILIKHFKYIEYSLPENTIQLKRGCKTKLAATLGKIHSQLSNVDKFISDIEYFKIVKCLSPYKNLSNYNLYKSLTRNRKDY